MRGERDPRNLDHPVRADLVVLADCRQRNRNRLLAVLRNGIPFDHADADHVVADVLESEELLDELLVEVVEIAGYLL
ncbi:hypothetical protein D3C87_1321730 [compost metagenome]